MSLDRFRAEEPSENKKRWGKLVKKWAKGEQALPHDLDELKAQCLADGVQIHLPAYVKGIVFVQNDKHILTVRLPPKELIESGEADIAANPGMPYPLADFYSEFAASPPPTLADKMKLHDARIGEYSVNSCA